MATSKDPLVEAVENLCHQVAELDSSVLAVEAQVEKGFRLLALTLLHIHNSDWTVSQQEQDTLREIEGSL